MRINSPTTVNTSTGFNLLEFHGPTVSNIVILGSCACLTAVGVVFLYRHISKKRQRREAKLLESARADPEIGMVPPSHRIQMSLPWSPGGPRPGTAYHAGGPTPHDALPYILAMARRHEEQEFQRGAMRMTELLEDIPPFQRQATTHALGDRRKVASNRAADALNAIIMASLGRASALPAGPTTSGLPPPSHKTSLT